MQETDPNAPPESAASESAASESAEAARERRLRALRTLASQQLGGALGGPLDDGGRAWSHASAGAPTAPAPPAAPAEPGARPGSRRRGRALAVGVGVVTLCVVVVAVAAFNSARLPLQLPFNQHPAAPLPPITTRSINPLNDGMSCFADATWSPNGNLLALLGYQRGCPDLFFAGSFTTGMITIYSATTGKPKTQILLDHLLTSQPNFPQNVGIIKYQNLLWSPDGQRLAITFAVENESFIGAGGFTLQILATGVLLLNADGSHVHAITILNPSLSASAGATGVEVDLTTGKTLTPPALSASAVAYRWGANGQLTALTNPADGTGAVGSPSGGPQFSVWQPGALEPGLASTDPTVPGNIQTIPNLYLWNTSVAAWSPDGRYFYAPLTVNRRIQLPGTPAAAANVPHELEADSGVTISPHDAAQAALYPTLLATGETDLEYSEGFLPATDVAWQPDGRVLAAQPLIGSTQNVTTLTLYNCANGKIIQKLTHDTQGTEIFQDNTGTRVGDPLVRWSRDGAHLALADPAFGTITLWTFNKPLV